MPITLDWSTTVTGNENLLNMWSTNLRNPQSAFKEMGRAMAVLQKDWFKTEGRGTWAPLSPQYAAWKKRNYPHRGILHGPDRPGHKGFQLRDQLTRRPFGYERITRTEFSYGSTLPYSKYHRTGAGRLPVRDPLVPIDAQTIAILDTIVQRYIVNGTGGA